jgi:ubiquinone/menaquinone biosynthesis C-methylase UbiE
MASGCFDLLAADYDRTWTDSRPGHLQRNAVWRYMLPLFRSGDTVLDLGCGTGADAEQLARKHVCVYALDASPEMVRIARNRGVRAEVGKIEEIRGLGGPFDGVISNFGALNCVEDLSPLQSSLARLVRPGGHLVICLMGRFCLFESLHYLRRFQFRKAARRWTGQAHAGRLSLNVFYPDAGWVKHVMEPEFRLMCRTGIGLSVPPSYVAGLSQASLYVRDRIDERVARWPLLRSMADHQLFIFTRLRSGSPLQ